MILIWRGKGLLVVLFALVGLALAMGIKAVFDPRGDDEFRYMGIGLMLSGALCTAVGMALLKTHARGERHDLYFIPVVAWGPVICVVGLVAMINQSDRGGSQWHPPASTGQTTPVDPQEAKRLVDSLFVQKNGKPATPPTPQAIEVPDGFVFRPAFELEDEIVEAGTAFAVEISGQRRVLILSALHLLGPSGGAENDVPPAEVPQRVKSLMLGDLFTDEILYDGPATGLAILDSAPLGQKSKSGDVIAFWIDRNPKIKPRKLATRKPAMGERVYLVAQIVNGGKQQTRLHPAKVSVLDKNGDLEYIFDTLGLYLRATSGAPVINQNGEVVAIHLGGSELRQNGRPIATIGVGNPVTKFRTPLQLAISDERSKTRFAAIPPIVESPTFPGKSIEPIETPPAPVAPVAPVEPDIETPAVKPLAPEKTPDPAPVPVAPPSSTTPPTTPAPPAPKREPATKPRAPSVVNPPAPPAPPRPARPSTPRPATRSTKHIQTQSKLRLLASRVQFSAMRENDRFPASLDDVKVPTIRAEDKVDAWGDAYLYFGAGKTRQVFDRSKTLLLATKQAHDGLRVVAYLSGDVEMISEEAFAELIKK